MSERDSYGGALAFLEAIREATGAGRAPDMQLYLGVLTPGGGVMLDFFDTILAPEELLYTDEMRYYIQNGNYVGQRVIVAAANSNEMVVLARVFGASDFYERPINRFLDGKWFLDGTWPLE